MRQRVRGPFLRLHLLVALSVDFFSDGDQGPPITLEALTSKARSYLSYEIGLYNLKCVFYFYSCSWIGLLVIEVAYHTETLNRV
jgi:hypothetical protein